jgi:hypothetical protein
MTDRWWAPAGAHIGPDEVDLALLAPGGEVRYDLGAALFALHRTGAAACEVVAASPIPTVETLIENLATARAAVAMPLVDSISKSLGDAPYAGLLVRDVADDAERAAVDLFSAAVAKGVAPPLAAQRVGMVYGVPANGLGAFRALAVTPAANPVALADAADRALFGFVEKLCTNEVENLVEEVEVSKAPEPWEAEPRNAAGEWTATAVADKPLLERLRTHQVAAPEVQTTPVPTRQTRQVRQTRKVRQTRQVRQVAETETAPSAKVRTKTRIKSRKPLVAMSKARQKERLSTPVQPSFDPSTDDLMEPMQFHQQGPYDRLERPVSFLMNTADFNHFKERLGKEPEFRMGHLVEEAKAPEYFNSPARHNKARGLAEYTRNFVGGTEPKHRVIKDGDPMRMREDINHAVIEMAQEYAEEDMGLDLDEHTEDFRDVVDEETQAIYDNGVHQDHTGDNWVVVHNRPGDKDVSLVEFVLDHYDARALDDSHSSHGEIEMDPNQVYKIDLDNHVLVYDTGAKAWVTRYTIKPAPEWDDDDDLHSGPIGKASTSYLTEARNELGQWTKTAEAPVAAPTRQTRQVRQTRATRQVRQVAATPDVVRPKVRNKSRQRQRLSTRLQQTLKQEFKPASVTKTERLPQFPELSYEPVHQVIQGHDYASLLQSEGWRGTGIPSTLEITSDEAKNILFTHEAITGDDAIDYLNHYTHDDLENQRQIGAYRERPLIDIEDDPLVLDVTSDASKAHFNARVRQVLHRNPDISQIEVSEIEKYGEHKAEVMLYGNAEPVPTNCLIIFDDIDPDRPMEMTYLSTRQMPPTDTTHIASYQDAEHADHKVTYTTLTAPKVHVFRVGNTPDPLRD